MGKCSIVEFLKACSKMTLNVEDEKLICQYAMNLDWDIVNLLERHKIHLIFLKNVDRMGFVDKLDRRIVENFSNQLLYLQLKYDEHISYLFNVLNKKTMQIIKYAVLKGFSFTNNLYKLNGIIYRPFGDIDILINYKDIKAVDDALREENLIQGNVKERNIIPADRMELIYWKLNSHQVHSYITFSKFSSVSPIYQVKFDINLSIFEGGNVVDPIDVDTVLSHRITRNIANNLDVYCLDYTWGLLQLCYHFYKDTVYEVKKVTHNDYCLLKFCDIREYILKYRENINWQEFISNVNGAKIGNQIFYTLWLVASFYGDLDIEDILQQLAVTKTFCSDEIDWETLLL